MTNKISRTFSSAAGRVSIYTNATSSVHVSSGSTWTSVTISSTRPADDFNADPLWTPSAQARKTTATKMKRDIQNAQSVEELLSKRYPPPDYRAIEPPPLSSAPEDPPYVPEMPSFPPARFLKY